MILNIGQVNHHSFFEPQEKEKFKKELSSLSLHEVSPPKVPKKPWSERCITVLRSWDAKIEAVVPAFWFQRKIDELGEYIQQTFAPLSDFSKWIDRGGQGSWEVQLATFVCKLPMRSARNVIRLAYNVVKLLLYIAVHPIKGTNHLAQMIIVLIDEFTLPETWTKMGAAMMGAGLGQGLIVSLPMSHLALWGAGALILGGLVLGMLKAALHAQKGEKFESLNVNGWEQIKALPEAFLTGFFTGLVVGGVEKGIDSHTRAVSKGARTANVHSPQQEALEYSDELIDRYKLPKYDDVSYQREESIFQSMKICWKLAKKSRKKTLSFFRKNYPELFKGQNPNNLESLSWDVDLKSTKGGGRLTACFLNVRKKPSRTQISIPFHAPSLLREEGKTRFSPAVQAAIDAYRLEEQKQSSSAFAS